ncbi:hypothetical protein BT67DRAFT_459985 [Trichocladium antarcticum]|uniref:Uncharacterized protein n=1 Tax=Trichocladium antarcticum TaxID=1450529 RepID=A0AAN6UR16_9PEZI|nr:hypothetical protein BT67DRAFT_459985 [Trichocladium antarcticum]
MRLPRRLHDLPTVDLLFAFSAAAGPAGAHLSTPTFLFTSFSSRPVLSSPTTTIIPFPSSIAPWTGAGSRGGSIKGGEACKDTP